MESGEPEAEQEAGPDDLPGEFQVTDSVGGDSEAPEADQKMESGIYFRSIAYISSGIL